MGRVEVAQTAGFCFGVRRAVDLAGQKAAECHELYALGEIIHNTHEIRRLEAELDELRARMGAQPDEVPAQADETEA